MTERTSDEDKARLQEYVELLGAERIYEYEGKDTLWWLSFADDDGFRGACLVPGTDIVSAARASHLLGCNPGGQVLGHQLPPDMAVRVDATDVGRLLDLAACREFDRKMLARDEVTE